MSIDLDGARAFMTAHARLLDRRRFDVVAGRGFAARQGIVRALEAYRNLDGGFGWGLEPDLRAPESQPGAALHALEAIADAGPATSPHTVPLLDWLNKTTLPDGGLPFALPMADPVASAPFWAQADPAESSLQITSVVALHAHRAARHDKTVGDHPWLETATRYCLDAIRRIDEAPTGYVLGFSLQLLDVLADARPEALELLDHLGQWVPADGHLPVFGADEKLSPLLYAPEPGRPVRKLLDPGAVEADLDRMAGGQQPDGGWTVDFPSFSPAAALEWRGYTTVDAVDVLRRNGR